MKEEEYPQQIDLALVSRISRRNLVLRAAWVCGVLPVAAAHRFYEYEKDKRQTFDRRFFGFPSLPDPEFSELTLSYSETPVDFEGDEYDPEEELYKINFELKKPGQLLLTVAGGMHDPLFVDPLIAQSENKRRYLVPAIHTEENGRSIPTTVNLGRYEEGEHSITFKRHPSVNTDLDFDPTIIQLAVPSQDSLLARFLEHTPVIKIKDQDNPLDDVPLMSFGKIYQKDGLYKVTTYIIFSSENGGKLPPDLVYSFGRTVDIEWVMERLFDAQGNPMGKPRYQTRSHRGEKFGGKEVFDNQPVLDTATPNNTFDDGRITIPIFNYSLDNPLDESEDDALYYSPKPVFLPGADAGEDIIAQYPELQKWSLIELGMENCLHNSDPELTEVLSDMARIRQMINTEFPDRGCHTLLSGQNFTDLITP